MSAVLAFIFSILFWPGIASAATTPRWAFLAIVVPVVLFSVKEIRLTSSHILLALIIAWVSIGFFWSTVSYDWMLGFSRLLIVAGTFLIGAQLQSLRPLLVGASIGLMLNSVLVIAQVYGFHSIQQVVSPAGLFMNKNLLAEFAGLVLVGVVYERIWWAIIPVLPSVILTESRGVYVTLISVVALLVFRKRPTVVVYLLAASIAVFGTYYLSHFDGSVMERLAIWRDTFAGYSWLGRGLGQFYVTYPEYATLVDTLAQRPEHVHNDLLELGYELGVGASMVIAFVVVTWRAALPTERAILLAFGVIGIFSFPFYMPATAAIFALVAGRLARAGASLRNDLDACRMAFRRSCAVSTRFFYSSLSLGERQQTIPPGISDQERASVSLHSIEASRNAA